LVTLTIDGKEVTVEPGTTVIRAAEKLGIFIPHYCFHPSLSIAGSCRLCLVEIEGAPKPMVSCVIPVTEGMVVHTDTPAVKRSREIVLEFLLLNHPLDCPVCDKAGECLLQDYSFEYGSGHSRFTEQKRVSPFKDLGPNIKLATTRCILCTRCVRFMREIAGDPQLCLINRGSRNEIGVAQGVALDHPLAGNVVDICPVGALLDKNFMHRTRVWHLEHAPSVCGECSAGCNVYFDVYGNAIFRIRPRVNPGVNGYWICDAGRYGYKKYAALKRITSPKRREEHSAAAISWEEAVHEVAAGFGRFTKTKDAVAGILSASATNEDAFALRQFMQNAAHSGLVSGFFTHPAEKDQQFKGGFVIRGDKLPNQAGLQLILGREQPDVYSRSLLEKIESGQVKAAYVVHTDLSEIPEWVLETLRKLSFLVVEDVVMSPVAQIADIILPGTLYFEKSGTYLNYQRCLQLLQRAVVAPAGARDTWEILRLVAAHQKQQFAWMSSGEIFLKIAQRYDECEGLSHFKLGGAGKLLGKRSGVREPADK